VKNRETLEQNHKFGGGAIGTVSPCDLDTVATTRSAMFDVGCCCFEHIDDAPNARALKEQVVAVLQRSGLARSCTTGRTCGTPRARLYRAMFTAAAKTVAKCLPVRRKRRSSSETLHSRAFDEDSALRGEVLGVS